MGTAMLFEVPGSLFNIAKLLKYMELGQCCLIRASGIFRKHLTEAFWLAERCEDTPCAGISGYSPVPTRRSNDVPCLPSREEPTQRGRCLMAVHDSFSDIGRGATGEAAIGLECRFHTVLCTFPVAGPKYSA